MDKKTKVSVKQSQGGGPSLLVHILLALGLSFGIVLLIRWGLSEYTHHGVAVRVPELQGKMVGVAIRELEDIGLQYEIVDSTYNVEATPGTVADVVPVSGSEVKPNRIIFLRVYAHEPTRVSIPWVEGQSVRNALVRLRALGFEHITEKAVSSQDIGACIGLTRQDGTPLKAGDMLPKNTPIVVLVGAHIIDSLTLNDLIDGYGSDSLRPKSPPRAVVDEPVDDPDDWFN